MIMASTTIYTRAAGDGRSVEEEARYIPMPSGRKRRETPQSPLATCAPYALRASRPAEAGARLAHHDSDCPFRASFYVSRLPATVQSSRRRRTTRSTRHANLCDMPNVRSYRPPTLVVVSSVMNHPPAHPTRASSISQARRGIALAETQHRATLPSHSPANTSFRSIMLTPQG